VPELSKPPPPLPRSGRKVHPIRPAPISSLFRQADAATDPMVPRFGESEPSVVLSDSIVAPPAPKTPQRETPAYLPPPDPALTDDEMVKQFVRPSRGPLLVVALGALVLAAAVGTALARYSHSFQSAAPPVGDFETPAPAPLVQPEAPTNVGELPAGPVAVASVTRKVMRAQPKPEGARPTPSRSKPVHRVQRHPAAPVSELKRPQF
jgi:hypothetical protein